jgi:hypothetical protein
MRRLTALALAGCVVMAGCGRSTDRREGQAIQAADPVSTSSTGTPSTGSPATINSSTTTTSTATSRTQPRATGRWRAVDPGPLATRGEPKAVWTGKEVLVVGGLIIDQYQALSDGAAFDPDSGSWRPIPPRPVPGRVMFAVWTGEEMVTFGTEGISLEKLSTGAAFNPSTGQWRNLSLPPSTKLPHEVVWTGSRVLAWQPGGASPGALYEPGTDQWTPIPSNSVPGAIAAGQAVWTGEELAAEGSVTPANGGPAEQRLFLYDPERGAWRVSPRLPGDLAMWPFLPPLWSGREVVLNSGRAGSGETATYAYDPKSDRWRTIGNPDTSVAPAYFRGVRLDDGRVVARVGNREQPFQVLDPKSGRWSAYGPPSGALPAPDGALVSVGSSVFHWGIATDGSMVKPRSPNAAWLWRP